MRPFLVSMALALLTAGWTAAQPPAPVPGPAPLPAPQKIEVQEPAPAPAPGPPTFKERLRHWWHRNDPAQNGATRPDGRYPPLQNHHSNQSSLTTPPPADLSGRGW
jgi:hypothetical protein